MTEGPIFLDYHAHGPLAPQVADALREAFRDHDANPHAGSIASEAAKSAIDKARRALGDLLGVPASGLTFTSGATEANNLALTGLAGYLLEEGRKRIVVSAIEHPSVLSTAKALADRFEVVIAPVRSNGLIDLDRLRTLVTPDTGLVSVAAANHEIGVVQSLTEIADIAKSAGALFHSDLAQAAGKIPLDLSGVHLASVSAHKLHGPFGVGALYVQRPVQRRLQAILHGGGQERGIRSGTLPVALCIAFGVAADLARQSIEYDSMRVSALRSRLCDGLLQCGQAEVNGDWDHRLPGNLNIRFHGVDAEALVMRLRHEIVISTGSACTSEALDPSPVLLALGLDRQSAESSVRLGLGRYTTISDVDTAISRISAAVTELRAINRRAVA